MTRLTRRLAFSLGAAVFAAPRSVFAQAVAPPGPHSLPPLGYATDANEPWIDAQTMMLHHGRHHAALVAGLNAAIAQAPQLAALSIPDLLARLGEVPENLRTTVRNTGGGHANHAMFWTIMGGKGGAPSGDLAEAIARDLGGMDKLRTDFNANGLRVFGSGWTFVTVARDGKLALATRPNQDTPLMDGQRVLMGNDVWEHAYYLKYQNRRAEYLTAWWNALNWDVIARRYAEAKAGTLGV
jgi:Fe-Mn family superoxide dismutase